ncbi:succinyl-diaminopimelate desuccinylase [Rivibacter subsaxonicus]|uniref:Succinyl-diaminopimelate desuccinylase n=1 Tax=Rivibacter subsaxonicus TaxID=457575 RepID=A0A4Q7VEJ9_9BURK|nr:succinyl-diaminopimelate desuccinylase [Rivibacter subsaxonicus]RZT93612.1 succinyldiaminopimelate desuccinylase [Rivibacter subsaxonicus]
MDLQHETLRLAEQLIARRSVTPDDADCQQLIGERLAACGFELQTLQSGPEDFRVTNLWAIRRGSAGSAGKLLVFAGHTDVVPTGPLERWTNDPFVPSHRDGLLFGRGAADMKSSLAAMVVAAESFVAAQAQHAGGIAFLLTSDEEGPANDGTVRVVEWLREQGTRLDYCVVGEPSCVGVLGDMIKHGRRGSLSARLVIHGVQGHVAYPQLADNPIHRLGAPLAELVAMRWDEGNEHFPPTSMQVSNLHAGTGAGNVIPGEAVLDFNFRYSTASTPEQLKQRVHELLDRHGLRYTLAWTLGGLPFLTAPGTLTDAMRASIRAVTGREAVLSTTGGTSDGRFIAQICPQLVELGPINASIHKIDEHVAVADLGPLAQIYRGVLERLIA